MANAHRGEIAAELGGKNFVLCLTLGALAELESRFGERDLVGLASRIEAGRLSARDLLAIIGCGLRGAGNLLTDEEVAGLPVQGGLSGYVDIVGRLLGATFGNGQDSPPVPR